MGASERCTRTRKPCTLGFIQSPEGEPDPGGEIFDEQRVTGFEPGQFISAARRDGHHSRYGQPNRRI